MANISLTSYKIIKSDSNLKDIESIILPDGRKPPEHCFTCLYGARDSIIALQDARIKARKNNYELLRVNFSLEGSQPSSRLSLESAKKSTHLNTTKINKDLEREIVYRINNKDLRRGLSDIINEKPELINDIFNLDIFKNLNVIIWPASFKSSQKIQVATVKDTSKLIIRSEDKNLRFI